MFDFVIQKMLNCKWIIICLLIGNILMISVACANPMYTDAIQIKSLNQEISDYIEEKNSYPGTITVDAVLNVEDQKNNIDTFKNGLEMFKDMKKEFSIKNLGEIYHYYLEKKKGLTENKYGGMQKEIELAIGYMSDFKDHIQMVSGDLFSDKKGKDGVIDAVISQKALVKQRLVIGEVLTFESVIMSDGSPLKIRISGVYENNKEDDLYWINTPSELTSEIFISQDIFEKEFLNLDKPTQSLRAALYLILDCSQMRENVISGLLDKANWYSNQFKNETDLVFRANYISLLQDHTTMMTKVKASLRILQIPILVLLIAFIFMVSSQILEIEKNDIAILKSRGASKKQILKTYLLQSAILAGISIIVALPFAAIICQMFGSSNAFMSFVSRGALSIRLTWSVLGYCVISAIVGIIAMIIPVFAYANTSIVEHKQRKNSLKSKPFWKKYYIDIIITAVSVYGLITFNRQKEILSEAIKNGGSLDPLLYLCSSLFIIGVGLIILRLMPIALKFFFNLFKNKLKPDIYAAVLRMVRGFNKQNFIMIFLILTLALGIFNAKAAHTINSNEEKRIKYSYGADVVLQEKWDDNTNEQNSSSADTPETDSEDGDQLTSPEEEINADNYTEPDFSKYLTIKGVKHAAKVYLTNNAQFSISVDTTKITKDNYEDYDQEIVKAYYESKGKMTEYALGQKLTLMGINTKDFGETAWFDSNFLPQHWYNYLNAISQNGSAVLVSDNFKDLGYKLGDKLVYQTETGQEINGIIFGFVEYWPTYISSVEQLDENGNSVEIPQYLVVANISKLQQTDGVLPYQVWLDVDGSTQPIYNFIGDKSIKLDSFYDSYKAGIDMKNNALIQGTNGILTMSFIVVLVLCIVGMLIYWIISVQSRALQFGIFRAMGMTMKEIINMLICEQFIITIPCIIAGIVIGLTSAGLFVPLIQIAYVSSNIALPLTMAGAFWDITKMFIAVLLAVGGCIWVISKIIDRIHISQALKLGED